MQKCMGKERIKMQYYTASIVQNKSLKNKDFLTMGGGVLPNLKNNLTQFLITTADGIIPLVFFYI